MGRPPCCDKIGVKKGPWTPEEDIILVSYIQENGPGNWRAVPANTGLLRCSKSCRLRWTNYLRPGIKRGNFTEHEEKMIIHLQALLGNRWAAIASYLPLRTDNDIKNYWNTHLRKKLGKKLEGDNIDEHGKHHSMTKGQWEMRLQTDIHMAKQALCEALSLRKSDTNSTIYASELFPKPLSPNTSDAPNSIQTANKFPQTNKYPSSMENIVNLLGNWMNKTPKSMDESGSSESEGTFFSLNSSNSDVVSQSDEDNNNTTKGSLENQMPFSLIEKWLLDDAAAQGQEGDFVDIGETSDLF